MKFQALGSRHAKRATQIVLTAENENEEAALFEKFYSMQMAPPGLPEWIEDTLKTLEDSPQDSMEIAKRLGISKTAVSNRLRELLDKNLVTREPKNVGTGGRAYVWTIKRRTLDEAIPNEIFR